jgi:hypothetical protein
VLTGCAGDTTQLDTAVQGSPAEHPAALESFRVPLAGDATAETAIPAILVAGHEQLVAACGQTPRASVRIMNPLAPDDLADVACSAILDGTWQTSDALTHATTGEQTGEAREPLTPIGGLLCSLASLVATTAAANECRKWRGPDSEFCGVGTFISGSAWIAACYIAF